MTFDLKPYSSYKDSSVEWLGDVPDHWRVLPGRACYSEKKESNAGLKEKIVLSLSYGQIVIKPEEKLHGLVPESFETYQIVDPGDIIIRPTDLQNDWNSLRFGLSHHRGIITSAYMCFHTNEILDRSFGHLLLHTYDLKKIFYGLGSGLRQNLDWKDFKYLPCCVPPLPEQIAIVRFLDYIDKRIRKAINSKKKLIKLLEEEKQAIINQAVTRGLDPDVKMKTSGVEWFGDVPEHWEVKRLKNFTNIYGRIGFRGYTTSDLVEKGEGAISLSPTNICSNEIEYSKCSYLSWAKYMESPEIKVSNGDIIFVKTGSSYGKSTIVLDLPEKATINPQLIVIKNIHSNPAYLMYCLNSQIIKNQIEISVIGGTIPTISQSKIGSFYIILPPPLEQDAIVSFIDDYLTSFKVRISNVQKEIDLLREYRTRLISDVVTGKLDVRDAAARLPEETEEPDDIEEIELDGDTAGDYDLTGDEIDANIEMDET